MSGYKYTPKQEKELLKSMVVLIDTREQKNDHICEYFASKDIRFISKKLDFGDYSFFLPKNEDLAIPHDLHFSDEFVIERKASLDELAGNMKGGSGEVNERQRMTNEMRAKGDAKMFMMIEAGSVDDMLNGNYRSEYDKRAFSGSMMAFQHRYDLHIDYVSKEKAGEFIASHFYYYLRERIRNGFCGIRRNDER